MIPWPLLVVTDRHGTNRPLPETVRAVLAGGARWIWLRDRNMEPEARQALAIELLAIIRAAGGRLTIGGEPSLADALHTDSVHLGGIENGDPTPWPHLEVRARSGCLEGDLQPAPRSLEPSFEAAARHLRMREQRGGTAAIDADNRSLSYRIAAARTALGARALVGISAHSVCEIRAAAAAGADYATLSPIFSSPSKPGYGPALGLGALHEAARIGLPVIALGGIGPAEGRACRMAGAAGVAVMGGLMRARDPEAETRRLLAALACDP